MQREVIKFNGKPADIELAQSTGKPGENDYGPFYTYTLAGNRVMFATEALNEIIQSKKPYPGMRLTVQLMAGNKWDVRPVDPPPVASTSPETYAPAAVTTTATRQQSNMPAMPTKVQYGMAFANFLILAADAVRVAERNSPAGSVRFDNRDVAAIATSMFIAADKAGYLTWNGAAQGGM